MTMDDNGNTLQYDHQVYTPCRRLGYSSLTDNGFPEAVQPLSTWDSANAGAMIAIPFCLKLIVERFAVSWLSRRGNS